MMYSKEEGSACSTLTEKLGFKNFVLILILFFSEEFLACISKIISSFLLLPFVGFSV